MNQAILLHSPGSRSKAIEAVRAAPIDGKTVVELRPRRERRTAAQNRLMWGWHAQWARFENETRRDSNNPMDKDGAHLRFKWRHVAPIICRRDDDAAVLVAQADRHPNPDGRAMMCRAVAKLLSTTDLTLDEMSEALSEYFEQAQAARCFFTHPDDLYREAMGYR